MIRQSINARCGLAGLAGLSLAVLAACGPSATPVTPEMVAAAEKAGGLAGVSGAPVNCPPQVATPAPAAGTPVHDILGVRPGMTYDEAVNVLRCSDNKLAATVKNENTWRVNYAGVETRQGFVVEAPLTQEEEDARLKEIRDSYTGRGGRDDDPFGVKPGKVRYTASTVGVPGDERVVHFMSEQVFALDSLPPVESLKASLTQKYGAATKDMKDTGYRARTYLAWGYDPSGQPTNRCDGSVTYYNLSDACGVIVAAEILPDEKNFDLASKLTVVTLISDKGYAQLDKANAELAAFAAKRRAEGVEKAKENAEAPKL